MRDGVFGCRLNPGCNVRCNMADETGNTIIGNDGNDSNDDSGVGDDDDDDDGDDGSVIMR